MSVTTDGIKGYEYQYKVTVLISLLRDIDKKELYVERIGSEDATLKIRQNDNDQIIEIQVKRENNLLDIPKVVEWLCHFQERKSNNNLLQRLADSNDIISLFVTHSRCSDDIVILRNEIKRIDIHKKFKIPTKWRDDFISKLNKISFGDSKLMSERKTYCEAQSKVFNTTESLSSILQRVLIWEEFSDEKIDNEIINALNTKYQIAQSKALDVYLYLLEIVRQGRDSGENILPNILTTLQRYKMGRPQTTSEFFPRDEESHLLDSLETNGVLLLTGISQCGKSEIAKRLATTYFDKGYNYKITKEVDEIQRFFSTNPYENKVAILEDPWGHLSLIEDSYELKKKLEDLLTNIEPQNKLIVTCRLEILFELNKANNLEKCRLNSVKWTDLTITQISYIQQFWLSLSASKDIPHDVTNQFSKIIENSIPTHLIQIGQIRYLANQELVTLLNKSATDLEHIARSNSKDIASLIKKKDEYVAEVLSVLSLCCNTILKVSKTDLAYILNDDNSNISIINSRFYTTHLVDKRPKYPKYKQKNLLHDETVRAIEYIEERQLIMIVNDEISFTHPNYYEAARDLLFPISQSKQEKILKYLNNSSVCLNPINSFLGTKQFFFVYNNIKKELRTKVIMNGLKCLNSIYPSVRDSSLIFLMNIVEDLNEEQTKKVVSEIQDGGISSSHIYWYNKKTPFISVNGSFSNLHTNFDKKITDRVLIQLKNKQLPELHDIWVFISNPNEYKVANIEMLNILLQCNEVFIRKRVVFEIFRKIEIANRNILLDIFKDEHPSVVFNAIRATFINWPAFSTELKDFLTNQIVQVLNKRQVAIRAFNFISTFAIDYGSDSIFNLKDFDEIQTKEIWGLWGMLFPITLKNIPLEIFFNTSRFGVTMDEATKHIDINVGINVLNAWFKRIDYQIKNNKMLDEYEMAIADNLIELTKYDYVIRQDLFNKLINYNDTSFILSNLKWLLNYWNFLDVSEKFQIIELINSDRTDSRWIKAVSLNSNDVPTEIAIAIVGIEITSDCDIDSILARFSNDFLIDCLKVYFGEPQPLWWLAVHHKNTNFWNKVIRKILLLENHCAFELCLDEFLSHCVTGFTDIWGDGEQVWKDICKITLNKNIITDSLVYHTANCHYNYDATKFLWIELIESYKNINEESKIISLIVENIEILQQPGPHNDIFRIFDSKFIIKNIIPKLVPDDIIIKLLKLLGENPFISNDEKIKMMSQTIEILKDKRIRFVGTFNFIENLEEEDIPAVIITKLKKLPNTIDTIGKKELEKRRKKYEYKLDNWIGIN